MNGSVSSQSVGFVQASSLNVQLNDQTNSVKLKRVQLMLKGIQHNLDFLGSKCAICTLGDIQNHWSTYKTLFTTSKDALVEAGASTVMWEHVEGMNESSQHKCRLNMILLLYPKFYTNTCISNKIKKKHRGVRYIYYMYFNEKYRLVFHADDSNRTTDISFRPIIDSYNFTSQQGLTHQISTKTFRTACIAATYTSSIARSNWNFFWSLSLNPVHPNVIYCFITRTIPTKRLLHYFEIANNISGRLTP